MIHPKLKRMISQLFYLGLRRAGATITVKYSKIDNKNIYANKVKFNYFVDRLFEFQLFPLNMLVSEKIMGK